MTGFIVLILIVISVLFIVLPIPPEIDTKKKDYKEKYE